ncbi:MAG: hypothetical protein ACRENN_00680 [Candidatus Eiseniibacteriota bacterium]
MIRLRSLAGAALVMALLAPSGARADSVVLHWTAPGDDGTTGRAASYDLRYRTVSISGTDTLGWWNAATNAGTLPQPGTAGTAQSFTVAGLDSETIYYFIIRTADEVPNWAGFSNVAVKSTGTTGTTLATPTGFTAQNIAAGVRLAWNQVTTGSPAGYHIYRRSSLGSLGTLVRTAPVNQTSWDDTTTADGTTYEYSIASYSGSNESAPALATITTPGANPANAADEKLVIFPNPAHGHATLRFRAGTADGAPGRIRLVVYDLTGHNIRTLIDEDMPAGETTVDWTCDSDTGHTVAPGLYNAILESPMGRKVTRLAIVP